MEKICTKCKVLLPLSRFSKDKYKPSGHRTACKQCSSKEFAKYFQTDNYRERLGKYKEQRHQKKVENPRQVWAHHAYHNAKTRAKDCGVEFTITKEWVMDNLVDVCPLLGLSLDYAAKRSYDASASLDRKDSSVGYTPENCKVISFKANRIKNNATVDEIFRLAEALKTY